MSDHLILQAIVTKYLSPTNYRSGRIKAECAGGKLTIGYDHGCGIEENHTRAAHALALKMGWAGRYVAGSMPGNTGNCYVCADNGYSRYSEVDDIQRGEFTISRDPATGESVHFVPPVKK